MNSNDLTSNESAFDIGYPLDEALADANWWLRGTTMYEGMRGWKAALSVIMADRDRLTARNAELVKAVRFLADEFGISTSSASFLGVGCGCCAGDVRIPDELVPVIHAALKGDATP